MVKSRLLIGRIILEAGCCDIVSLMLDMDFAASELERRRIQDHGLIRRTLIIRYTNSLPLVLFVMSSTN